MLRLIVKSNGIWPTKLGLDFLAWPGRGVSMDEHTDDLIAQLCTRIGVIMEDASVTALTVGGKCLSDRLAVIDELDGAAKRIDALVTAVRALLP
jgi:hypothetical protein